MTGTLRRFFGGRRWIAALAIVLVAAGCVYWFGFRSSVANAADTPTTRTTTVTASLQTMEKSASATGTLTPAVQEDVNFAAAGHVLTVEVAVGDIVTEGQTRATIDTGQLTVTKAQANYNLAQAQQRVDAATTANTGTTTTKAALALAQAQLVTAQQAMDTAAAAMSDATLTAPVTGQVTAVNLAPGDSVTAGASGPVSASGGGSGGSGSTAQFTIIGTDAWIVNTSVAEADIANVTVNEQVTMTADAAGAKIFGTVQSVSAVATASQGSAAFPVVVAVTGTPAGLHDGVSVTASIVYERRTDVLAVPSAAVTTVGGVATVTKVDDAGKQTTQDVTIGEVNAGFTEITAGLAEGDTVAITVVTNPGTNSRTGNNGNNGFTGQFPGGFQGRTNNGGNGSNGGGPIQQFQLPDGSTIIRDGNGGPGGN
jgi:macrolide-specific efflux system membrane fusion protein